jgi:hydrogenase nickel incorporation protein HypA/HybF
MHEAALAQSVADIVEQVSKDNAGARVTSVTLKIGELAGVEIQSFLQSMRTAQHGSCFEEADIVIERPAGQAWCMDCCRSVPLHRLGSSCPYCGGFHLTPNGGTEFRVSKISLTS